MKELPIDALWRHVRALEKRFRLHETDLGRQLMYDYDRVVPKLTTSLRSERDELLARAGALMLIAEMLGESGETPETA